ncbi:hypothetical protein HPB48_021260 [Haemaphysalis longicornis]|uniref:Secreted protein n=1 Tax=Haemaphysalis longicornis TaxID=44386 RepID=A0A9J6FKM0_HAELO|nr:hypothetical protein HPB48_021260 [Haemaphysalis longicornis]
MGWKYALLLFYFCFFAADFESSSEDSLTAQELLGEDWECARPNSSANLDSPDGWFTGASLSYQLPCTATEGTTCQIVAHLSTWNKVLWLVFWQLRETPGMAGKLSLVSLHGPRERYCSPQQQSQVIQHVCWLLRTHRCVAHVEWCVLPYYSDHSLVELLVDAIRASEFITSVKLAFSFCRLDKDLASAVLSLPHLVELECEDITKAMVAELPTFLRGSTSLTSLRLEDGMFSSAISEDFFREVGQSSSLKELVLSSGIIVYAQPTAQAALTECLKNSTSLTSLTVTPDLVEHMPLRCILEGLFESRSLLAVDITCPRIGQADVQLMSQIFEHNSVLQSFRIESDFGFYSAGPSAKVDSDRCLKALVGNRTLEQVALPIEVWDEGQWKELFEALPTNRNLRKVIIKFPNTVFLYGEYPPLVGGLCVSLKGTAAEEKVSFDCPFDSKGLHESFMCKAFSSVALCARVENGETACGLLVRLLPSLGHITSMLDLNLFSQWQGPTSSSVLSSHHVFGSNSHP